MSKKYDLKVTVRMRQKYHPSIDLVSFNQLILEDKDCGDMKKFQFDRIYQSTDTNQKLFENILRVPTNLLLDGFSSMIFCLGSPNSGKTYTLAGNMRYSNLEFGEPGIITYLMRRFFSKFKHQVSLYSSYSVWCKVLTIERDQVINMTTHLKKLHQISKPLSKKKSFSKTQKFISDREYPIKDSMQIKNYSHFQEIIEAIYRNNNNKKHVIIQVSLRKQLANDKSTTSSITFVEFGSFFYNCPFREAEELQMENQIESVLNLLKNLSKSEDVTSKHYESSVLTKILRDNFQKSTSFQIMGVLDESYHNNIKTLNFLDMMMGRRNEHRITKNVKEQIKRQQIFLKNLYQKHRKVLNLLSKCIGMQLGSLQKRKRNGSFDGPIMNSFYKTCQKVKFANQKKLQNQKLLQESRKQIQKQINQFFKIQEEYKVKFSKLQADKKKLVEKKKHLLEVYQSITNPQIKFNNNDYSLYWRPEESDLQNNQSHLKYQVNSGHNGLNQVEEEPGRISAVDSQKQSKQANKSFRLMPSQNNLAASKIQNKLEYSKKKFKYGKNFQKYERSDDTIQSLIQQRTIKQMRREAGKLFSLIIQKQKQIQKGNQFLQNNKSLSKTSILINRIKNRADKAKFNHKLALQCYKDLLKSESLANSISAQSSDVYKKCTNEYIDFLETLKIQQRIQRDIENKTMISSMNAISMRSLNTQKIIKN